MRNGTAYRISYWYTKQRLVVYLYRSDRTINKYIVYQRYIYSTNKKKTKKKQKRNKLLPIMPNKWLLTTQNNSEIGTNYGKDGNILYGFRKELRIHQIKFKIQLNNVLVQTSIKIRFWRFYYFLSLSNDKEYKKKIY